MDPHSDEAAANYGIKLGDPPEDTYMGTVDGMYSMPAAYIPPLEAEPGNSASASGIEDANWNAGSEEIDAMFSADPMQVDAPVTACIHLTRFLEMAQKSWEPSAAEAKAMADRTRKFQEFLAEKASKRGAPAAPSGDFAATQKKAASAAESGESRCARQDIRFTLSESMFFQAFDDCEPARRLLEKRGCTVTADVRSFIRSFTTVISYVRGDTSEPVKCSLASKPEHVKETEFSVVFELRPEQVETVMKLLAITVRHGAVVNAAEMGYGKTPITVALMNILMELGFIDTALIIAGSQLQANWTRVIDNMGAGSQLQETFIVNSENIKQRSLPYHIAASKAARKFVMISASLFNSIDNAPFLRDISEASRKYARVFDEFHTNGRKDTTPNDVAGQGLDNAKATVLVTATPVISGVLGKEETTLINFIAPRVDTRTQSDLLAKSKRGELIEPRAKMTRVIDTRNLHQDEKLRIFKLLSVMAEKPGKAGQRCSPPPAIYSVRVQRTTQGTSSDAIRKEMHGNNEYFGHSQRLLAMLRSAIIAIRINEARFRSGADTKFRCALIVVNNIQCLRDMKVALDKVGMPSVEIHGSIPRGDREKNIYRLETESGLTGLGTPAMCCNGLNLQNVSVLLISALGYVVPLDLQLFARVDRRGQEVSPVILAFTSGAVDERAASISQAKDESTMPFYEVHPGTGKAVDSRPMLRNLDDDDIEPMLWGMYAAKDAGHTLNGDCFAPHYLTGLQPPASEQEWAALTTSLKACKFSLPIVSLATTLAMLFSQDDPATA